MFDDRGRDPIVQAAIDQIISAVMKDRAGSEKMTLSNLEALLNSLVDQVLATKRDK